MTKSLKNVKNEKCPLMDLEYGEKTEKDRKSTRLNSSHLGISYAVFCLKKKKQKNQEAKEKGEHKNQNKQEKPHAQDKATEQLQTPTNTKTNTETHNTYKHKQLYTQRK